MSIYNYPSIVVTGLGPVTAIGYGKNDFWDGIKSGRSGAGMIQSFDTTLFTTKFACECLSLDVDAYITRREKQRMDRFTHLAMVASCLAIEDAKIDLSNINKDRVGVVVGSGIGGM